MCTTTRLHRESDSPRLESLGRPGHETTVLKLLHTATSLKHEAQGVSGAPKSSATIACWTSARASTVRWRTTCRYHDHRKAHEQNQVCHRRNAGSSTKPGVGTARQGARNKTRFVTEITWVYTRNRMRKHTAQALKKHASIGSPVMKTTRRDVPTVPPIDVADHACRDR